MLIHGTEFLMHHAQHMHRNQVPVRPCIQYAGSLVLRGVVEKANLVLQRELALGEEDQRDCHLLGVHVGCLLHEARVVAEAAVETYQRVDAIVARGGEEIGDTSPC